MEDFVKLNALKSIPPVNEILERQGVKTLIASFGRTVVIENLKQLLEAYRVKINTRLYESDEVLYRARDEIAAYIEAGLKKMLFEIDSLGLKRVINATGIVLHTNLGRAPLPDKAAEAIKNACKGYCNLEFDLETGLRGSRHSHIEALTAKVTGAESAIIVNNNAAAVFLCLNTLSGNREVIVSRGQQVEIGGSFRIPDIIARSGAIMREVGTTNKTRLSDYKNAITGDTAVLLRVHTSNYKVTGFTEEVSLNEMADLGRENGLTVIEDLGSGCLYNLSSIGLPYEPTVQDTIKSGADIVTFSGDKLLGGPQAGIIAGRRELIEKIKKNPLTRMVRCDKTTIAAMAAVLSLYMDKDRLLENVPVLRMLALKEEELSRKAYELEKLIKDILNEKCSTEVIDEQDEAGGGSLPGVFQNGKAVAISALEYSANELQQKLRKADTPVICRIYKDRILLNVRTIEDTDYPHIIEALLRILE